MNPTRSSARQAQIQELFEELSELPPDKQNSLLKTISRSDKELGREVETLLRRLDSADEQFERFANHLGRESSLLGQAEKPGTRIGNYLLLEPIGEGGFGRVWLAEQERPVHRQVALKIIKVGMDTQEVVARFEAERQALALMEHPGIATVHDAGATETGRPYFVMEFVRGIPITRYCDEQGLSAAGRLRLFTEVCHAVQHAHQKGIIHRDLKPSNILVTLHDGKPVPKIIDFGIAKATTRQLTDKTLYTRLHTFIGTPVYCSPEQVARDGVDIDTRSDIYSLGVVLYELLSGCLPFQPELLAQSGFELVCRTICEIDPPTPSTRIRSLPEAEATTVARQRATEPERLALILRGDLDWIVMHCLEKDRTRRYATANELATDIENYLGHRPIIARPPTRAYRLRKFVRRNKAAVTAASVVAISLLVGIAGSTWQAVRATRAENRTALALESEAHARRESEALHFDRHAKRLIFDDAGEGNAHGLAHAIASLERRDSPERRRLALAALWKGPLYSELKPMQGHIPSDIAEFTSDGKWLITCSRGPEVLFWPADGGPPMILPEHPDYESMTFNISPSGRWLLVTYKVKGSPLFTGPWKQVLWDLRSYQPAREWTVDQWGPHWFSPDESWLLAYNLGRQTPYAGFARWNLGDGSIQPLGSPVAAPPTTLRFPAGDKIKFYYSPSDNLEWLVSWDGNGVFLSRINEDSIGEAVCIGRDRENVLSASVSPNGDLVSSANHNWMTIWAREQPGRPLARFPSKYASAFFDLEYSRVFGSWPDPNICYIAYDLRAPVGAKGIQFLPFWNTPFGLAVLPGGQMIAIASWSEWGARKTFLYNMRAVWPFRMDLGISENPAQNCIRFSPDRRQVAFVNEGRVFLVQLSSDEFPGRIVYESPGNLVIYTLAFSPDGDDLLVGTHRDGAWLVPLDGTPPRKFPDAPSFTSAAAFSPDGNLIAVGGGYADLAPEERYTRILDQDGRLVVRMPQGGTEVVQDLKFITQDELVVSSNAALRLWNIATNEVRLLKEGGHAMVAVSGDLILANDADGFWLYEYPSLHTRKLAMDPEWEPSSLGNSLSLAISPDEAFVVTRKNRGDLCVQYVGQDRYHLLPGTAGGLSDLWISQDGRWIGAVNERGKLTYWPVPRGEPLHDRPLDEFLAILRRQTNIRVVMDLESPDGFHYETEPFPGWLDIPAWQEWVSPDYMENIAWEPALDLTALGLKPEGH